VGGLRDDRAESGTDKLIEIAALVTDSDLNISAMASTW
jgi:oligoribonuclease (3'-5' exoribonuclease)